MFYASLFDPATPLKRSSRFGNIKAYMPLQIMVSLSVANFTIPVNWEHSGGLQKNEFENKKQNGRFACFFH